MMENTVLKDKGIAQLSRAAKGHGIMTAAKPSKLNTAQPQRPKMPSKLVSTLKSELVEFLELPRERLITTDALKLLVKQDDQIRLAERILADKLEKNEEEEDKKKTHIRDQLKNSAKKEKLQKTIQQVKGVHSRNTLVEKEHKIKDAQLRVLKQKEKERKGQILPGADQGYPMNYSDLLKQELLVGEDEEEKGIEEVKPIYEELAGEFEDADWSEAEEYGYHKEFPYKKKDFLVNKEQSLIPADVPDAVEKKKTTQHEVKPKLVVLEEKEKEVPEEKKTEVPEEKKKEVPEEKKKEVPEESVRKSNLKGKEIPKEKEVKVKVEVKEHHESESDARESSDDSLDEVIRLRSTSDHLLEMSQVHKLLNKATSDIHILMEKIIPKGDKKNKSVIYSQNKFEPTANRPLRSFRTAEEIFMGEGDDEFNVGVGTDVVPVWDPNRIRPPMLDKSTGVHPKDIRRAFRKLTALELSEDEGEELEWDEEDDEQGEFQVRRVSSTQRDASILVRPIGYKELELSEAMSESLMKINVDIQVNEHIIDEEYAIAKGIVLSQNDILWPTVGEFDLEKVVHRIKDYINQFWQLDPKWMFYIQLLQTFSDEVRKCYVFEVKFSMPTPQSPIASATASVYFVFNISHYALVDEFVKVHYVVESTRFLHTPNSVPFQDKWLWSIVSDKIRLQRAIDIEVYENVNVNAHIPHNLVA